MTDKILGAPETIGEDLSFFYICTHAYLGVYKGIYFLNY
jgi:hypothetical protein